MNVLGIFFQGPNTGACLFCDGALIAIVEEERFTRQKTASEVFPGQSIRYCLREGKLTLRDVDVVSTSWNHDQYPEAMGAHMRSIPGRELDPMADRFERIVHEKLAPDLARFQIQVNLHKIDSKADPKIVWYPHHLCHAASVHYLSGFAESAILVLDGSGEEYATTTWHGRGESISSLKHWTLPDSLGWFYAAMTEWLGFRAYSGEGKVMGLAPYGKPNNVLRKKLHQFCRQDSDQVYRIDPTFVYFGPRTYSRRFTDDLVDLLGAPRLPETELTDYHTDVAYATQELLEEVAEGISRRMLDQSGARNLCISGGVAMNCKMNGMLSNLSGVEQVFINPASHDSGTSLGSALLATRDGGGDPLRTKLEHAYWGPAFSDDEIETLLKHCQIPAERPADIAEATADLLAEGKIVGWFQGRAEFGARALGARSILANPLLPDMKATINAKVKYREAFRPFAPSLIEEVQDKYMLEPKDSPFMILAYPFKDEYKSQFPSIVHVDDSVRPHTVSRETNPLYWRMIEAFGRRTGHPVVLNTSLNVRGEPIVGTPRDAIRCFFATGMDALALGPFLVSKSAGRVV